MILCKFYLYYLNNQLGPKKFELSISPNSAFKKYVNPIDKLKTDFDKQVVIGDDYSNIKLPDMKIVLIRNKLKIVN